MNKIKDHFNQIASSYDYFKQKNRYYYSNLKSLLASIIPPDTNVLEVGCGTGDLLEYLQPKYGFGQDISPKMIKIAKSKHPQLHFSTHLPASHFDYIFMSDVIEHLEDPHSVFFQIGKGMKKKSLLLITMANPLWEPLLMLGEKINYKMPEGPHNRIGYTQLRSFLLDSNLSIINHEYKLLIPIHIPFVTVFLNKHLEPHLKPLCFIEYVIAKKT